MILYIQTPSIPRSELHNVLIKTMVEHLDKCNQFSEIRWFVNIDAIKTSKTKNGIYQWEDPKITKQNFINISSKLKTTTLNINISNDPCFYLAFRYLTLSVLEDISKSKLANSEYCVMWLEDDWSFIDKEKFNINLDKFLNSKQYKCYILYRNKINMGGNPDIIKGDIFKLFTDINLDKTNKRDPENIRKHDVWYPNIFIDPFEGGEKLEKPPYHLLLKKLISINGNINHEGRKTQIKILSSNVVEGEQGDKWRANLNINKEWDTNDKHGITPNRSYSYK
tara:strand:- start:12228 stop:13067 length:840 start_codon:yes stop_codon:yes gene_type:complete